MPKHLTAPLANLLKNKLSQNAFKILYVWSSKQYEDKSKNFQEHKNYVFKRFAVNVYDHLNNLNTLNKRKNKIKF